MVNIKVKLFSNHEDGDSFENVISIELSSELLNDFVMAEEIDWAKLNSSILNYPDYYSIVKNEVVKNKIEIPDPNYWTTTGVVISFNNNTIPDNYDMFDIEDKLMTGDLI